MTASKSPASHWWTLASVGNSGVGTRCDVGAFEVQP